MSSLRRILRETLEEAGSSRLEVLYGVYGRGPVSTGRGGTRRLRGEYGVMQDVTR
jgi:hypothetical protein